MEIFRRLGNTFKEALKTIYKNLNLGLVTIASAFFTLFIICVIIIVSLNANKIAKEMKSKVNEVEVFIKSDATKFEIDKLKSEIDKININKKVKFRSSEEALDIMKKSWGKNSDLLDNIESKGLLPASFVVALENIEDIDNFVNQIKGKDSIDDIKYFNDLIKKTTDIANYIKVLGTIFIIIFMIVSFFIISNTIKLTVYSRSNEIAVMRYVGASNWYIAIPIIIEGVVLSLVASLLAFGASYGVYSYIFDTYLHQVTNNIGIINFINPQELTFTLLKIMLSLGLFIGLVSSVFSIRKYLSKKEVEYVK